MEFEDFITLEEEEFARLMVWAYKKGYEGSTKTLKEACELLSNTVNEEELKRIFTKLLKIIAFIKQTHYIDLNLSLYDLR